MRKALSISLILAFALAGSAFAKPVQYNVRSLDNTSSDIMGKTQGVFSSAVGGTTYFGGTYWNGTTARWEALADSVWTFDTGMGSDFNDGDPEVDPFKFGTGRHTHMEGWVGRDDTYGGDNPYFRLLSDSADGGVGGDFDWDAVCVGTTVGLSGNNSWWAGRSKGEVLAATLDCYYTGQGYGNSWSVYIEKTFAGVSSSASGATLKFNAYVDSEDDFDYVLAFVDTGDGEFQEVWSASGAGLGLVAANVPLPQGTYWPETSQDVTIRFGFESDGAYSDQDGFQPTDCGGGSIDDVEVTGDLTYGPQDFESGADGWTKISSPPGIGDWSDLMHFSDLPSAPATSCNCDLQDTILVAFDPAGLDAHPLDQETLIQSPWIDIDAEGLTGSPVKFFQYSTYANTPLINFVFRFHQMKWYPVYCAGTGLTIESAWADDNTVYYGDPFCDSVGQIPTRLDYSDVADPGAQKLRIAIGTLNLCSGWAACTGITNYSPVFDNVSVGIGGLVDAPFLSTSPWDTPYDSFPESGTLRPTAAGRVDCNQANDENQPFSSVGDTLVVAGGGGAWGPYGGVIVEVVYFVSPGPGTDGGNLAAWNALHTNEGDLNGNGETWYSARMDTAEVANNAGGNSTWMTAYHEDDANGPAAGQDTLKDSNDLNPYGLQTRLAYDIFPDDLFTPGTHIGFAFRASYVDTNTGLTTGTYYYHPPSFLTAGDYMELEVLPSSMAADSTWNCVLYVNHADDRGAGFEGSTVLVENALDAVISGSSGNYDGTPYDIFDVEAPSSNQGSFGRPIGSEYGCSPNQVVAYNHIIWYSRSLSATAFKEPDADVLTSWLTSLNADVKGNRFYGTGDGLADAMNQSSSASVQTFLGSLLGADLTCNSYRQAGCNDSGVQDTDTCIKLDPVGIGSGAHFDASTLPVAIIGNGCPVERDYDVLTPGGGALDDAQANEEYNNTNTATVTQYSSVSHDVSTLSGIVYRTVLDGTRIDNRRDNATCNDGTFDANDQDTINNRMSQVGTWLGFAGAGVSCDNPYEGLDVGPKNPTFVTALRAARPNPFTGKGLVNLEFSMEAKGKAKLEVFDVNGRLVNTIFNGVAAAGPNVVEWDAKDQAGNSLASGVYFYRLSADGKELAKKQVVVRSGN
jgi:hypothetical protein